jgi:hypothetical protein
MAFHDWGNKPLFSTQGITAAPSTGSIIGAIDSTVLGTAFYRAGQSGHFRVTWIVGCDTNAGWQLERATNSSLDSAAETIWLRSPSNQSGQYVAPMVLEKDQFLRARMFSTGANAVAYINAEPLT